jgi:hypothetical protein
VSIYHIARLEICGQGQGHTKWALGLKDPTPTPREARWALRAQRPARDALHPYEVTPLWLSIGPAGPTKQGN